MAKKDYRLYLNHVLYAIDILERIKVEDGFKDFDVDPILQSSAAYQLIIIGEAINAIPSEVLSKEDEVPWDAIRAMRNRLAHEYYSIDYKIVQTIMSDEVDILKRANIRLLSNLY
jgi:uncharacterized protein with HEPN domain